MDSQFFELYKDYNNFQLDNRYYEITNEIGEVRKELINAGGSSGKEPTTPEQKEYSDKIKSLCTEIDVIAKLSRAYRLRRF